MTASGKPESKSFLEQHWPLALSLLAFVVLSLTYFPLFKINVSSGRALLLAIVPNLASNLLIFMCLYLLLRRDLPGAAPSGDRMSRMTDEQIAFLGNGLASLTATVRTLSDQSEILHKRSEIPSLDVLFRDSTTISIIAVSGLGIVNHHRSLLEEQIAQGKKLRVALLDARRREALQVWDRLSNPPMNTPLEDIRAGLRQFLGLSALKNYPGSCDVRIMDIAFPYSLIMCDKGNLGEMQVEMHAYHRAPDERPNILLSSLGNPHWYRFFEQQFEELWSRAQPPPQ